MWSPLEEREGGSLLCRHTLTHVHLQLGVSRAAATRLRPARSAPPSDLSPRSSHPALPDLPEQRGLRGGGGVGGGGRLGYTVAQAGGEAERRETPGDFVGTFPNKLSDRRGCCCCTFYVKLKVSHARVKPAF